MTFQGEYHFILPGLPTINHPLSYESVLIVAHEPPSFSQIAIFWTPPAAYAESIIGNPLSPITASETAMTVWQTLV
mgnify:CR=1 FL=1